MRRQEGGRGSSPSITQCCFLLSPTYLPPLSLTPFPPVPSLFPSVLSAFLLYRWRHFLGPSWGKYSGLVGGGFQKGKRLPSRGQSKKRERGRGGGRKDALSPRPPIAPLAAVHGCGGVRCGGTGDASLMPQCLLTQQTQQGAFHPCLATLAQLKTRHKKNCHVNEPRMRSNPHQCM